MKNIVIIFISIFILIVVSCGGSRFSIEKSINENEELASKYFYYYLYSDAEKIYDRLIISIEDKRFSYLDKSIYRYYDSKFRLRKVICQLLEMLE